VRARRGKWVALSVLAGSLLAAGGAAYLCRDALLERLYLYRLRGSDPAFWPHAAHRLGELRSAKAVPRLVELLLYNLNQTRSDSRPELFSRPLAMIGEPAVPALVPLVASSGDQVRTVVTPILVEIGKPSVLPLSDLLGMKGEALHIRVLDILGKLGPTSRPSLPALIRTLRDDAPSVRRSAVEVIGRIGEGAREAVPSLLEMLKDEVPYVARSAVSAAAGIDPSNPSIGPALATCLKETDDPLSRIVFASTLARIDPGNDAPIGVILDALSETHQSGDYQYSVRLAALRSLAELGPRAREAAPVLNALLATADGAIREAALEALNRIRGE
jgi:HEAT repeat protein